MNNFKIKRGAYLLSKRIIEAIPPLRNLNDGRKKKVLDAKRANLADHGLKDAEKICGILTESGFTVVAMFGTLLGVVRDHKLIAHDDDMDFALLMDSSFNWADVEKAMINSGYEKIKQYEFRGEVVEQAYRAEGFSFDLFGFVPQGADDVYRTYFFKAEDYVSYNDASERTARYLDVTVSNRVEYSKPQGYNIPIPSNYEDVLVRVYGENWRVPVSGWVSGTGYTLVEDCFGICRAS